MLAAGGRNVWVLGRQGLASSRCSADIGRHSFLRAASPVANVGEVGLQEYFHCAARHKTSGPRDLPTGGHSRRLWSFRTIPPHVRHLPKSRLVDLARQPTQQLDVLRRCAKAKATGGRLPAIKQPHEQPEQPTDTKVHAGSAHVNIGLACRCGALDGLSKVAVRSDGLCRRRPFCGSRTFSGCEISSRARWGDYPAKSFPRNHDRSADRWLPRKS